MTAQASKISYLAALLRPIVRFCLRHCYPIQDFTEVAKQVFVQVAAEEMRRGQGKVNVSRLSVVTGIYRMDVDRILAQRGPKSDTPTDLIGKVVGLWEQSKKYCTPNKRPRILSCDSQESEFHELVRSVSQHVSPGSVLAEMERIGVVERTPSGLKMIRDYQRLGQRDPGDGFEIVGSDIDTLLRAAEENILDPGSTTNLHLTTSYSNIYRRDIPKIRRWLLDEGKKFHRRARNFLARFDADINPRGDAGEDAGGTVSIATFSFTEPR